MWTKSCIHFIWFINKMKHSGNTSSSYRTDTGSSESEEPAGSSQTAHPGLPGIQKIVSEEELAQLTQIRPRTFSFDKQSAFKDYLKILERKGVFDITQEFGDLERKKSRCSECTYGNEPWNRQKNRYRDIIPYESTRVPLGKSQDYINASYIRIINQEEEYFYIATQGPLPDTIDDFWQMVFEHNSNVIAMVTRDIEDGIIKCHNYWPVSPEEPLELRQFRICLKNYQILAYFIVRMFQVVKKPTETSLMVKHVQFTKWADHGIPASTDSFIKYVRYVRKSHCTGPMVVHCSAGVGRTGVFICTDVAFCAMEKSYLFDIVNIVTQMREQRYGMIQTKEQYCFTYEIILKVLKKFLALE
ncbi:PREDICTED: tyrosine-protein phosphatase non-receptor type 20 isoform X2 [Chinchilla lanigera]|uniref:tyrosine-protein phosphatase non-receptor type 20 isoform X2 n=1 Tax=Chinchilla lanigera TaxID=34839 RepID=UPI00038EB5C6|nr:PREDICTED: tyrosine-protein phosphatase non-receptor type 20 isoform X2 [Chinchilla lanigera]XP_005412663.1 PREDICTED: tyrosine-protein phosphatase non-receptor type 20 isoform X2 [Chinchilla lanigera]XP_005412664.1 PREDICTED: tyrosine-protein phosphatase non-receptor type 20 isoform X2 [Chinchilla lanigera]XP_005412665.1 PREDICTED: tyrosine-protein phosphatase non-receptor type 20 isoform X2 [Chinchilla lanigera]